MHFLEEVPFSTTPSAPLKEASRLLLDVASTPEGSGARSGSFTPSKTSPAEACAKSQRGLTGTLNHGRLCRPLFQRLPPEEIPDGMVGCFERDVRAKQVLGRESVSGSVGEKVKQHRVLQTYIPVDQNIERQMHHRPEPVAYNQRPRVRQNEPE